MSLVLAALQGAVFGIIAMRLVGSESLRFALYGAIAFPLLSTLVSALWPRFAAGLGLLLIGVWTATGGAAAYEDPSLQAWEWIPALAFAGLLFGAGANSYLFRGIAEGERDREIDERCRAGSAGPRAGAPSGREHAGAPSPPQPRRDPDADPWLVLGVAPGAPPLEVQRAFRARMAQYHPDKVATLGAELRELAEVKSKEITAAYAALDRR